MEYRVRWKGFGPDEDTWETTKTLANARDCIRDYDDALDQVQVNAIQRKRRRQKIKNPDRVDTSIQCKALTKRGHQCKNRTRRSEYCRPHLQQHRNLRITDSNIADAGLGLFAGKKGFAKNQIVTPYTGVESKEQIAGNYVLEAAKNRFINANRNIDIAGFANDCRAVNRKNEECKNNNCKYSLNNQTKNVNILSTKKIQPFEEIYVPYGQDYWRNMPKQKSD